ncbi:hypothetical protein OV090_12560 [Nannocystis sp. RBIL2]|uniref:hypothetical protein n=1 Tax=Nannocystis sp. RBIL2 TaxID=2996788 RepID=UPI00227020A8|nr:hypothetical protein [Nannocystis sp. RBIL2]MCY1065604.1 hypothetical protein [Nannocystis sp. RBIL2]
MFPDKIFVTERRRRILDKLERALADAVECALGPLLRALPREVADVAAFREPRVLRRRSRLSRSCPEAPVSMLGHVALGRLELSLCSVMFAA